MTAEKHNAHPRRRGTHRPVPKDPYRVIVEAGEHISDPGVMQVLNKIADEMHHNVFVTDGDRGEAENKAARGAVGSLHTKDRAGDFAVVGIPNKKVFEWLKENAHKVFDPNESYEVVLHDTGSGRPHLHIGRAPSKIKQDGVASFIVETKPGQYTKKEFFAFDDDSTVAVKFPSAGPNKNGSVIARNSKTGGQKTANRKNTHAHVPEVEHQVDEQTASVEDAPPVDAQPLRSVFDRNFVPARVVEKTRSVFERNSISQVVAPVPDGATPDVLAQAADAAAPAVRNIRPREREDNTPNLFAGLVHDGSLGTARDVDAVRQPVDPVQALRRLIRGGDNVDGLVTPGITPGIAGGRGAPTREV